MRTRRSGRSICRSWLAFELAGLLLVSGCLIEPKEADCEGATDCVECLDRSGCGWCEPRGRCVPGTSTGPSDELLDCESELEFIDSGWRYSSCGSCARLTNCFECQEESCTWCGDGAGYCVSPVDDAACRNPLESRDGCGGAFPTPDMGPGVGGCTNTCSDAFDGLCDDGGPGADFSICDFGTDCADCGPR